MKVNDVLRKGDVYLRVLAIKDESCLGFFFGSMMSSTLKDEGSAFSSLGTGIHLRCNRNHSFPQ